MKYLLVYADDGELEVQVFADKQTAGEEYFLLSAVMARVFLYEVSLDGEQPRFRQIPPQEVKYPRNEAGGGGII